MNDQPTHRKTIEDVRYRPLRDRVVKEETNTYDHLCEVGISIYALDRELPAPRTV